jgi:uncharacterized protein YcnI
MGGSSNPVKDLVKTVEKAYQDTGSTIKKGVEQVDDATGNITGIGTVGAAIDAADDMFSEVARWEREGIHLDPNVKQKLETQHADQQAARDAAAATQRQSREREAQLKTKAANTEASEGSNIILGGKRKKKKGSKVSSGMGLSTGDTGLQV